MVFLHRTYLVVVVVSALGEAVTELLGVLGAARTLGALAGALSVGVGLGLVGGRDLMRVCKRVVAEDGRKYTEDGSH